MTTTNPIPYGTREHQCPDCKEFSRPFISPFHEQDGKWICNDCYLYGPIEDEEPAKIIKDKPVKIYIPDTSDRIWVCEVTVGFIENSLYHRYSIPCFPSTAEKPTLRLIPTLLKTIDIIRSEYIFEDLHVVYLRLIKEKKDEYKTEINYHVQYKIKIDLTLTNEDILKHLDESLKLNPHTYKQERKVKNDTSI